jgi:hypothetical protein
VEGGAGGQLDQKWRRQMAIREREQDGGGGWIWQLAGRRRGWARGEEKGEGASERRDWIVRFGGEITAVQ